MIRNSEPLSITEALEFIKDEEKTELIGFIKKFTKLSVKDAGELRKELDGLNIMKVKSESIAKIIDILPDNSEELNKIFIDVSLDEDETKKILEIVKKFK